METVKRERETSGQVKLSKVLYHVSIKLLRNVSADFNLIG